MKILAILLLAAATCLAAGDQTPDPTPETITWLIGPEEALRRASASRRPLLVNSTGSDWCIWCHRLRDEILLQKHFLDYATRHLLLLEVDSPHKTQLPAALARQNDALKEKYRITGYPTLLLLSADGKELGRLAYMQGGPKTFVREIKRLLGAPGAPGPGNPGPP